MSSSNTLNLSTETIGVLKSFAGIQSNIVFTGGNTVQTMGETKTILASAQITETLPEAQIGIFDLPEFLGVLNMFSDPTLRFDDNFNYVDVFEGSNSVRYYLSDPSMLTYPKKQIQLPSTDLTFSLSKQELASVRKASSVLSAPDMVVSSQKGADMVDITVTDIENPTSNTFNIELPEDRFTKASDSTFSFIFKVANLNKMISNEDYDVQVSQKMFSHFQSRGSSGIQYWVALYKDSQYSADSESTTAA